VFIADWLSVFSRDQMLILRAEDYYSNITGTLSDVYQFLEVPPLSHERMDDINHSKPINTLSQNHDRSKENMMPKTRSLLTRFFKPFNIRLAELLGDSRFLWNN
jgi:N-acetylgalactosamine 4-sulfate 6-O-sulfotransferase